MYYIVIVYTYIVHVLYCDCVHLYCTCTILWLCTLILYILCRQDHESKRSHNDRSGAHAASRGQATSTAFTDVERDKKTPKAASAITSNGGMPSDYQVICCCTTVFKVLFLKVTIRMHWLSIGTFVQTLQASPLTEVLWYGTWLHSDDTMLHVLILISTMLSRNMVALRFFLPYWTEASLLEGYIGLINFTQKTLR